jgi:cytochrome P450
MVRLAPNEVSFIDAEACRDVYAYRSGHRPFPKNPVWVPEPPKDSGKAPSILNADDEDHARIRKAWAYGFSDKAFKDHEPLITSHVDMLITRLRQLIDTKTGDAILDIVKWYNFCVFDIIGDLAFGESFGCLDGQIYHSWIKTIIHHFKAAVLMSACRYYAWLYRLLVWSIPKTSIQKQYQHFLMTKQKVQSRLAIEQDKPDFLSHLTKAREALTDSEIESTAGIIIIAGSKSLTTTLAGTTNYLLRFPQALEKLSKEVRTAFRTEADINLTTLGQLPYLSSVIEEGLRIITPVPLGMPRLVPKGGDTVCGEWLPEDVSSCHTVLRILSTDLLFARLVSHSCNGERVSPRTVLLTQLSSDQSAGWIQVKLSCRHSRRIDGMLCSHSRLACVPALVRSLLTLSCD